MVLVVEHDTLLQVYLGLLVCVVSLVLVARHAPYANPLCGRVQLLCLTQLTFTYMAAVYFVDGGGGARDDKWATGLIGLHTLSFVILCWALVRAVDGSVRDVHGAVHSLRTGQLFELPPRPPNIEWHLFLSRCVPAASNRMRARIRCRRMP